MRRATAMGLAYVYLGYWVEGSTRMQYKVRYRPLERLGRDGWERIPADQQDALIASAAANRADRSADGSGKDNAPGEQDRFRLV